MTRILQRNKIQARPYATYDINDNFFNVIDTEEKAYTLGFFTADGCLTRRGVMIISVADRDVIEKIKHAMGHTSPIRVIPPPSNRPHCKTLYGLEVDRRQLSIDLRRLGCVPNKSFCTYLSEEVPSSLHRHFIRGLFDGDGSITKNKKTDQVHSFRICGTAKLLGAVLDIIRKETNIGGGIYPHQTIFYLSVCGRYQILRVLDWLYEDATIFMDRKHLRYQNFKKEMNNNGV